MQCKQRNISINLQKDKMEDEKVKKLKMKLALIENALRNAQRQEMILGIDAEDLCNELLDQWNELQESLRELEKK